MTDQENQRIRVHHALRLALASICKNPLPHGDTVQVFDVTNWDMRLSASLFYVTAGLILGYFSTIVERLNRLSEERIMEARGHGAIKQKLDLARAETRILSAMTGFLCSVNSPY